MEYERRHQCGPAFENNLSYVPDWWFKSQVHFTYQNVFPIVAWHYMALKCIFSMQNNGGEENLNKWRCENDDDDDPLQILKWYYNNLETIDRRTCLSIGYWILSVSFPKPWWYVRTMNIIFPSFIHSFTHPLVRHGFVYFIHLFIFFFLEDFGFRCVWCKGVTSNAVQRTWNVISLWQ